jgi:hypothetical protein
MWGTNMALASVDWGTRWGTSVEIAGHRIWTWNLPNEKYDCQYPQKYAYKGDIKKSLRISLILLRLGLLLPLNIFDIHFLIFLFPFIPFSSPTAFPYFVILFPSFYIFFYCFPSFYS